MKIDTVIARCVERKTTAPFLQLCCEWIRDGNDLSKLEGIGAACRMLPEQISEHVKTAQKYHKLMPKRSPRRELPSGNTFDERRVRAKKLTKLEQEFRVRAEQIAAAFTFGPKTHAAVVDAMVETWRDPEQFADTPAWCALVEKERQSQRGTGKPPPDAELNELDRKIESVRANPSIDAVELAAEFSVEFMGSGDWYDVVIHQRLWDATPTLDEDGVKAAVARGLERARPVPF